jgi:LuxR family maltose regulon positive regulatory protein
MPATGNSAPAAWPLHPPPAPPGEQFLNWHFKVGAVHALLGCLSEAHAMIRNRLHSAIESQDLHAAMGVAVQLAVCLDGLGEVREADWLFQRSLDLGRFARLYQVFVDGGKGVRPMLLRAFDQARQPGAANRDLLPYIESVLAQVSSHSPGCQKERAALRPSNGLSSRESDILDLVARGMSNKRIAHALNIAPETVKSHVKRIFIKLDVKTRAEAVSRANALWLSPPSGGFSKQPAFPRIEGNS